MKLTITIDMDNAAFEEDKTEAARLLHALANKGEILQSDGFIGCRIIDINGNTVGRCDITD